MTIVSDDRNCCLYYKCVVDLALVLASATVINYAPTLTLQIVVSNTHDSRGINYYHNMFIVHAKVY
jgi:hypothetical protein